jgi:hypothetical protein
VANPASANQIAFGLFLPGAEMMLAASLHSVHENEHQMLFQHVDCLGFGDLLLMDRGYPCRLAPNTGNCASVALRPALAGIGTSHRQQNS